MLSSLFCLGMAQRLLHSRSLCDRVGGAAGAVARYSPGVPEHQSGAECQVMVCYMCTIWVLPGCYILHIWVFHQIVSRHFHISAPSELLSYYFGVITIPADAMGPWSCTLPAPHSHPYFMLLQIFQLTGTIWGESRQMPWFWRYHGGMEVWRHHGNKNECTLYALERQESKACLSCRPEWVQPSMTSPTSRSCW